MFSLAKDVNDNAPLFEKRVMDVFLSEATRPNTQFLKVWMIFLARDQTFLEAFCNVNAMMY